MCTVSNLGTEFGRSFPERYPQWVPNVPALPSQDLSQFLQIPNNVTRAEFDALKAELKSLKKLMQAAKIYDAETGQKDCEQPEKVALFKKLAELVGVDLSEVFVK
jgi:hypothetical protein